MTYMKYFDCGGLYVPIPHVSRTSWLENTNKKLENRRALVTNTKQQRCANEQKESLKINLEGEGEERGQEWRGKWGVAEAEGVD